MSSSNDSLVNDAGCMLAVEFHIYCACFCKVMMIGSRFVFLCNYIEVMRLALLEFALFWTCRMFLIWDLLQVCSGIIRYSNLAQTRRRYSFLLFLLLRFLKRCSLLSWRAKLNRKRLPIIRKRLSSCVLFLICLVMLRPSTFPSLQSLMNWLETDISHQVV